MAENTQKLLDIIARQKRQIATLDKKLHEVQQKAVISSIYLETILEKSPEHLYWLDKDSRVIMCNDQQARSYGLACAKELIGMGIPEITKLLGWSEAIANQLQQNDLEVLTTKREITIEEIILIQGKERVFQSTKRPFYDKFGHVIGIFGISIDITERKKLECELRLAEERANIERLYLDNILANVPEHLYWMDKNEVILGCNDKQADSFGYKNKAEVIGKSIRQLGKNNAWTEKMIQAIHENNMEIMRTRQSMILEEDCIYEGKHKTLLSHKSPLIDKRGEVIGILGVTVDITERKRLEHELRLAEETANAEKLKYSIYLDNVLANVPEHLYLIDKNEIMLACNDKQARSFGFKNKSEVIGKSTRELAKNLGWNEEMIHIIHKNNKEIIETRQGMVIEEDSIYEGQHKTLLSYKNPLIDKNGCVIGVLGITVDITERKNLERDLITAKEQAEAANQAKSEFLMNMSHDLRTPFSGILSMTSFLFEHEQDPIKKDMQDVVLKSARRLLVLLNDVMEVSSIGGHPIEYREFAIKEVVDEVSELINAEIKMKGLNLLIDCPNTKVSIDKHRITRILLNLVGNAIKFTPEGTIKVKIVTSTYLTITVQDSGIGIPQDKLDIIFEKFSKLKPSNQHHTYMGSGLGLYIVKKFLDELHGSIQVTSELGKGSIFTCTIPL